MSTTVVKRMCVNCGYSWIPRSDSKRCPKGRHPWATPAPGRDWAKGKTWEEMGRPDLAALMEAMRKSKSMRPIPVLEKEGKILHPRFLGGNARLRAAEQLKWSVVDVEVMNDQTANRWRKVRLAEIMEVDER